MALAERLERSGASSTLAQTLAAELLDLRDRIRSETVTREYLDLALGKLRAEVEREIAQFRVDMERMLREQTNKLVTWLAAIIGVAATVIGGLGVLF